MKNENGYSTKDIYLAATLIAIGNFKYSLNKQGKIFFFVFDDPDSKIKSEVDKYWSKELMVDPRLLFNALKELKTRMYSGNEYEKSPYDKQS